MPPMPPHPYNLRPRTQDASGAPDASDSESESNLSIANLGRSYRVGAIHPLQLKSMMMMRKMTASPVVNKKPPEWDITMTPDEKAYYQRMSADEQTRLREAYQRWRCEGSSMPIRFKLLLLPESVLSPETRRFLIQKLEHFGSMNEDSSEYPKYTQWVRHLEQLPLGKYHSLAVSEPSAVADLLYRVQASLNASIYGHDDTKHQWMRVVAQWLSNPTSKGACIGIQGPMGIGKTTMVKEGVCHALGFPFGFVALGGASDAAFLEGHSFTYEGSTFGRIGEILLKSQVMNPVLFFDELDKVSASEKGQEILSVLTHLTDFSQNTTFTDKYFGGIELDMSRCLMIFSFNDITKIHPVLRNRLTILTMPGYTSNQKIQIARRHLIPRLETQFGFPKEAFLLPDEVVRSILAWIPTEPGVRLLVQALEKIYGWVNMARYIPTPPFSPALVQWPYCLKSEDLSHFLSKSQEDIPASMYL